MSLGISPEAADIVVAVYNAAALGDNLDDAVANAVPHLTEPARRDLVDDLVSMGIFDATDTSSMAHSYNTYQITKLTPEGKSLAYDLTLGADVDDPD